MSVQQIIQQRQLTPTQVVAMFGGDTEYARHVAKTICRTYINPPRWAKDLCPTSQWRGQ